MSYEQNITIVRSLGIQDDLILNIILNKFQFKKTFAPNKVNKIPIHS